MNIDFLSKHPIKNAKINNLDYYYIEKGQGDVVFLLHGFPDLANTWDETITELSKHYKCIAPFLRGYYPTSIAEDGDYSPKTIANEINELSQKLEINSYYVIGQDWGASVTYAIANLYPAKAKKIITVAIPHPSCLKITPIVLFKARHFLRFGNKNKSPQYTRKNNFAYLDKLYKRWSPNWIEYDKTSNVVKKTFEMPGRLEAALGYYWTFKKSLGDREIQLFYKKIPQMPLLTFAGKTDGGIMLNPFQKMKKIMPPSFRLIIDEKSGHFLHRENLELFLKEVLKFLNE